MNKLRALLNTALEAKDTPKITLKTGVEREVIINV